MAFVETRAGSRRHPARTGPGAGHRRRGDARAAGVHSLLVDPDLYATVVPLLVAAATVAWYRSYPWGRTPWRCVRTRT